MEDSVFLDTDDGKKMEAFYAHPKSDDPNETFPVVIFLMDAPGYRGELVYVSLSRSFCFSCFDLAVSNTAINLAQKHKDVRAGNKEVNR